MTHPNHPTPAADVHRPTSDAALHSPEPRQTQAAPCTTQPAATDMTAHTYLGTWTTSDGHVRHRLLPGGRYDEARGTRESAYRGSYAITGTHIDYVDDTGFTADGEFRDGVLYHGGMVLRRAAPTRQRATDHIQ